MRSIPRAEGPALVGGVPGALPAGDGVRARLLRRALSRRLCRRLGIRGRHVHGGQRVVRTAVEARAGARARARGLNDVRPLHFCDVTVDGERWPVFGWAIAGSQGTILVDTGMIDSTPSLDDRWSPVLRPWPELGEVVAVINTHLHFDHCGGNRRFAGTPTYVQRAELEAAVEPDYLVEWVHFDGESYVEVGGDAELFEGVSVLFT